MTAEEFCKAKRMLDEIRQGITEAELRIKYGVGFGDVEAAVGQLLDAASIQDQDEDHSGDSLASGNVLDQRRAARVTALLPVAVYDVEDAELKGFIADISESGLRVVGARSSVGEVKTFMLPTEVISEVEGLMFEATCRWVKPHGPSGATIAGFEITGITDEDMGHLKKLVQMLKFEA
ncbi:MAG: PilZ domain-containing protein [Thermodesulfobacteriota bacterium]